MLTRPVFKPHLRIATVPDEGVYVLSESKHSLLRGRLYELVARRLDGRTSDEICDLLADEASPAEVYFALGQLADKGLLSEVGEMPLAGDAAWWSAQGIDPCQATRRLEQGRVSLRALGVDPTPLRRLLAAFGMRVDDGAEFTIVAANHYLRGELAEVNDTALSTRRPWMLVRPVGRQLWIGPLFKPPATGCWKCLAQRLAANRPVESYLRSRTALAEAESIDAATTVANLHVAWGLAANAVASWLVRGELPDFEGRIRTFDLVSWETQTHTLPRLPYCPACGMRDRGLQDSAPPVELQTRKKTFWQDGGHRAVSPETTLARYAHHVSPITGAVSMLERLNVQGDGAMHVYVAGHNLARRHASLAQLRGDLRNMSAGKGITDIQAKASGLCEGLERYCGVFRGDEPRRTARMSELGEAAIDVRMCLLFSPRQYSERDKWNQKPSRYNFVPVPFDPEEEIGWSPAWSLSRQEVRWLPTAFCYYDYRLPSEHEFCVACSNGCAAGNTLEEAILQGFLELVERDSVALWWYNRVRRPGVDPSSFNEPYVAELLAFLGAQGRELQVLDLTSDLEIPVFAAWSGRAGSAEAQIVLGFGAHYDARIALLRAVTEMNQMLSHLLHSADRVYDEQITDLETVEWLKTATAANQPYLLPAADAPLRCAQDFARPWTDDFADDVRACQSLVERQGLEMLVLDQTRKEIGLPVVKVIVPGLRHFWARFAPGRLYDVPVRLGWVPQPRDEAELNPIPMFL